MAKLVMIGKCPNCGKVVQSRFPFEIGECKCENPPIQVPLEPALILPPRYMKKIEKVSELSEVPVEELVDALLKEISEAVLRGLKTR